MKKLVLIAVISAVAMFGVMASANAETAVTNLSATVSSRITVTAPADYDFGPVDPGTGVHTYSGNVNVRSNVAYTIAQAKTDDVAGKFSANVPANMDGTFSNPKAPSAAGFDWAQTYSFDSGDAASDWADPGLHTATFTYTTVP
jgi:hypothetical protein